MAEPLVNAQVLEAFLTATWPLLPFPSQALPGISWLQDTTRPSKKRYE